MSAYDTGALEPACTQAPDIPALDDRLRYAQELAQSGLLPNAYRGKPANVLVSIETGYMLGIAPMAALHNVHIIEGKPTFSAALMGALVRRAGHKFRVWFDEASKTGFAEIVRSDDPSFTYRVKWTYERAKQAGLLHKENWQKYGASMLKNRATSEVCRDAAQDVFLGPVYVPEELGSAVDAEGDPVVGSEQVPEQDAAARRIDWDADLNTLEGNRDGLRQLGELAKQYDESALPVGFRRRFREAWERMKGAPPPIGNDPVDAEIVDEQSDRCAGSAVQFDDAGWTVIVKDDGTELVMCQECDSWQWSSAGSVNEHVPGGEVR